MGFSSNVMKKSFKYYSWREQTSQYIVFHAR